MQVALIIFSVALLGVIIYFVVSPKSSRLLRVSAIIALALIGLAVGVCGIFLIRGPAEVETTIPLPFLLDAEPKPENKTSAGIIIGYFAAFAIILALVAYSARKEKQRKYEPVKKPRRRAAREYQADNEDGAESGHETSSDESFDIGVD
jgi:amino acid transporter